MDKAIETIDDSFLSREAMRLIDRAQGASQRYLFGIAGLGASGKSTMAARLHAAIEAAQPGIAIVLPMDGFHLRNAELERRSLRELKGAPETFDAEGYIALLCQVKDLGWRGTFPIYDRNLHEPVWEEANHVEPHHRLVITEGNYLLLNEPPWTELGAVLDETWWLDTPIEQAMDWMIARHVRGGRSHADALAHFERSDRKNFERILDGRREPHRMVRWGKV